MNKILKVCLILVVLGVSLAEAQENNEEKGIFTRFVESLSVSSNPSFENSKFIPVEQNEAAFLQVREGNKEQSPTKPGEELIEPAVESPNAGVNKNANWDKNIFIEADHPEKKANMMDSKLTSNKKAKKIVSSMFQKMVKNSQPETNESKQPIFKDTTSKNKIFKEKATILAQTKTGDDPQPAQPQGGTIEDSKTAASIDSLKSQIKDDVDKATEDMKDDMKKNNEEMKEQLKAATDDLKDEIVQSQKNITQAVKNESKKVQDEIKKDTKMLKKEVDTVGLKVDDNLVQTIKLRIMALQDQLENKQDELYEVTAQANELRASLPPPKTICDTFYDCSTCTANSKCGWCIAEQKCVEGDNIGPLHMSCNFYDYKICSGGGCSRYKDCDSCIGDPLCGFCDENKKCLERPADFTGCKPTSWFHSQGNQPQCPLPEVTSADPLKEVPPKKIVEDGSVPKQVAVQADEPDAEKELIRKKQDQLIKLESRQSQLKIEIDQMKKELNKAKAERDKYEKILADNQNAMRQAEEEEEEEEEPEEEQPAQEEEENDENDGDENAAPEGEQAKQEAA